MNEQVGNEAFYFLAILEFRSGIPQFDPTIRETVQALRPVDWGNGNHSVVREAREIIRRNPEPKDFIPTMRQMGVLVHVMNVWDKSMTRMVMVGDHMEERQGDWKVRYRFSRHTTPLRAGIDSRSWFHYERPAQAGAAARHVHHGIEGYVMSSETAQRSAEIKARLAAGHDDEEEDEEIAVIDNRDAHPRPPYPWEVVPETPAQPDRAAILQSIVLFHFMPFMYAGTRILDSAHKHKDGILERIQRDERIKCQWHAGLPIMPVLDAVAAQWDADHAH